LRFFSGPEQDEEPRQGKDNLLDPGLAGAAVFLDVIEFGLAILIIHILIELNLI
jgi:hypothetical protein